MPSNRNGRQDQEEDSEGHKEDQALIRARMALTAEIRLFKQSMKALNEEIDKEQPDPDVLEIMYSVFQTQMYSLQESENKLFDVLLDNQDEEEYGQEKEKSAALRQECIKIEFKAKKIMQKTAQANSDNNSGVMLLDSSRGQRRKLPKLELPQFGGDVREWLPFWSQFEQIHSDEEITDSDKYMYLIQSTVPGSSPHEIVMSFPVCAKNYPMAVESLKDRYGRESMLVKVYVRDLLRLVVDNAQRKTVSLSSLYVMLSSKIRALETLGVTKDKCASIIYPLVESCIPEDVLRVWQRDLHCKGANESEEELEKLMEFLKKEVQGEDNIKLACASFSSEPQKNIQVRGSKPVKQITPTPTAAGLLSTDDPEEKLNASSCIFCNRNHLSELCGKADKISLDDKLKFIRRKRRCLVCLKPGHMAKACKSFVKCMICSRKHQTVMCPDAVHHKKKGSSSAERKDNEGDDGSVRRVADNANSVQTPDVLLQTLVVKIHGEKGTLLTRALLDTGSHKSYILKSLASQVGLRIMGEERVVHTLFGGHETGVEKHCRYKVKVSDINERYRCNLDVSDTKKISGHISSIPNGPWLEELRMSNITLSDVGLDDEIGVLIGADEAGHLLTGKKIELRSGPVAVETLLGWTLMGRLPKKNENKYDSTLLVTSMHIRDADLSKLWDLESIGIMDPTTTKSREELEEAAMKHFQDTVQMNQEGRYEIHLPWIEGHLPLPDNKRVAERRLNCVTQNLKRDGLYESYDRVFQEWEKLGMIEVVPEHERNAYGHYLPHRAVIKDSATTPIRPVFDASCKVKGSPSLNDCMEKGPNLLELIPAVITRFRLNKMGVLADIKKAFQQISVTSRDRNYLRFLWWEDNNCNVLKEYRHCRVVFGVSSSPFILGATLKHLLQAAPLHLMGTSGLLQDSLYVDNLVASVKTSEEALRLRREADELLLSSKFELRDWEIGPINECKDVPVLGLRWDMREDKLFCDVRVNNEDDLVITKRKILSLANAVFDPIGFSSPFTLIPKTILKEVCSLKLGWDAEVPDEIKKKFISWRKQLRRLKEVQIPRWISPNTDRGLWTLHVFVDASKTAYAAVVYLVVENNGGQSVQLLQAKSRVAPTLPVTIPRLELLGCGIGARLATAVKKMLHYEEIKVIYWSDSSTALYWIKNIGNWGIFVQRRVEEIRRLSSPDDWRHVPGTLNPADLPSRGCTLEQLKTSEWWEGPNFLKSGQQEWPNEVVPVNEYEVNSERKKNVVSSLSTEQDPIYDEICESSSYADMIQRVASSMKAEEHTQDFTVEELNLAEQKLLRMVQVRSFTGVNDIKLKKLYAFVDDNGLIRTRTRLLHGDFTEDFKSPVILPCKNKVVGALILQQHESNSHAGVQILMAILREKYWILKSRRTIRSVISKCPSCRIFDAPRMECEVAPLPKDRIQAEVPFQVTGVDLAGPLFLSDGRKTWIVLFTCAVYRAIHLELVTSLSTEDFKNSLRRFIARRGRPTIIYSDNGTNFQGCSNQFKRVNWTQVQKYARCKEITWRFNPPTAAWWGGWWERLVGVVKRSLKRVLGKATLGYEELQTVLCDVESSVNRRPLTYISEDPDDLAVLTPYMFLIGNPSSEVPEADVTDRKSLTKRLKYIQRLREDFRSRFRKEYLGQMTTARKKATRALREGEMVLIGQENKKRIDWPIGKIIQVIPGRDGKIRVVRVQTRDGVCLRPIQRIYPLEVEEEISGIPPQVEEKAATDQVSCTEKEKEDRLALADKRPEVVTKSGRRVKIPVRFTFINC
ncbi:unnamed protein product [Orchesella dallaii]|uniref:Integrase catalytic domain-containing protein n=1 Tax=Orchesella dallaii TaxID=48710 RepID=A0ABP1R6Z6_9HEXA